MLPRCTQSEQFDLKICELAKHYSVKNNYDITRHIMIFILTNISGKIECVNCSNEFVDVLLMD